MRQTVRRLGATLFKDISSFCVTVAADPVVNLFTPRHCAGFAALSSVLNDWNCVERPHALLAACGDDAEADFNNDGRDGVIAQLLCENRMLCCMLPAMSACRDVFNCMRHVLSDMLLSVQSTVMDDHLPRPGNDNKTVRYKEKRGDPRTSPEELRRRLLAEHPGASADPRVTGAFFPGMVGCRASPFIIPEEQELGTLAMIYQDAHKCVSPGTVSICFVCSHRNSIRFVALDKREGPPALLSAILSYFALLPLFVV